MLSQVLGGAHSATISVTPAATASALAIDRSNGVSARFAPTVRPPRQMLTAHAAAASSASAPRLPRPSARAEDRNSVPATMTAADATRPSRNARRTRLLAEPEHEERVTAGHRDVLLVADRERHRARADRTAGLELPQRLAALRIEREEVPFVRPAEDEPAGGRHHAGPRRRR